MSAIAVIVNMDGQPVDDAELKAMTAVVEHRGPDGKGHWIQKNAGLGILVHRTTLEEKAEQQPLVSGSGNRVIVWDGRLDNRSDLLRQLSESSVSTSSSDADIVLAASQKWGDECARFLVGDYAFAIWDSLDQRLLCVRDPMGARLLHYHFDGRRIVVGTEIKQIAQVADVTDSLDDLTIGLYLSGNTRYADRTFFRSIKRLSGGFSLAASPEGIKVKRFWDPAQWSDIRYRSEAEYLDHFRELMVKAVEDRLRCTGPIAIQLSGGLDSGAVTAFAAAMADEVGATVQTFHMTYAENPQPENRFADLSASAAGLPISYIPVDDQWAMKRTERTGVIDEPFTLPFESMSYRAFTHIRERGCEVVLTGEGGDEAFSAGYHLHMRDWLMGGKLWQLWRDYRGGTPGYRRQSRAMLRRAVTPGLRRIIKRGRHESIPPWLTRNFLSTTALSSALYEREAYRRDESDYLQIGGFSPFVVGNDRRASEAGVELRNPFWDSRLVEFMSRIPPGIRLQGGRQKLMLKKALKGYWPDELLNREPHGAFGPLLDRGFKDREVDRLEGLMSDSLLERMGVIDASIVMTRYRNYRAGDTTQFDRLFWTFATEEWLQSRAGN